MRQLVVEYRGPVYSCPVQLPCRLKLGKHLLHGQAARLPRKAFRAVEPLHIDAVLQRQDLTEELASVAVGRGQLVLALLALFFRLLSSSLIGNNAPHVTLL